jgi:hypothetical protein
VKHIITIERYLYKQRSRVVVVEVVACYTCAFHPFRQVFKLTSLLFIDPATTIILKVSVNFLTVTCGKLLLIKNEILLQEIDSIIKKAKTK